MTQYGEAFSWPARDPRWIGKLLVIGLLSLLPFIGPMNLLGWTLRSLDNLRDERYELAAANLTHIARGARLFVVLIACGIAFGLVAGALSALTVHALALAGLAGLVIALAGLVLAAVQPPLWLGLPPALAAARPVETLAAAALLWSGVLVAGLGFVVCGVGAVFTIPYGYAVIAGVLRVYELGLGRIAGQPA